MKVIIIGGVAGGATTAARIRRVDEAAEIILLEKGKYISYANCGLPYYIGGVIEEREKLFVQTPEAFSTRFRVDVRTENEVIFIDRKRKTVTVRRSSEDTYQESYDKLLISTGASPVRPPLPGIDLNGIFTLRNVADTDRIKEYINTHAPRRAVVIGAGFIGLEMAENLHAQGAKVSIVEMGNQVMAPIDFSMASLVHQHLMEKGVNLYLEQAVVSDRELAQVTFAMRIFDHDVDISYSTREPAFIRDHMATLGVTTMSAESKTEPGGYYSYPQTLEQFHVSDERKAVEVDKALKSLGREPVWKDWDASFDLKRV